MKFFHVYNEELFEGLIKNDLINQDSGFKLQHIFRLEDHLKFNKIAAVGSRLHSFIKENKFPFYVDRISGGTTYHKYDFDFKLIDEYKELLGDWFLGFQLHESASNRAYEWDIILNHLHSKGPYDVEEMKKQLLRENTRLPDGTMLPQLQQDTIEYFAERRYPETIESFYDNMVEMFERKMADTNGNILPCDSYFLATKIQDDMGMKSFMPEIGCQIPLTRLQIAMARGMAKAKSKTWGTYYECWRATPGLGYTMPCFNTHPLNEWYAKQENVEDDFSSYGKNGGSSRLLQERIYYYTLMSGADYFAEEWGLNCSYSNMETFELSEYGQIKKSFIKNALNFKGIKAVTPLAIVLPASFNCIMLPEPQDTYKLGVHRDTYFRRPLDKVKQNYIGHLEDVLKLFFVRTEEIGNEGHVMTNSRYGDLTDIIYEDAPSEVFDKYTYLIDATPDGKFAKAKASSSLNILESSDIAKLEKEIDALQKEVLPCYVDGLHWLVSTDETDKRYLSIFNNEGNERDIKEGDIIHEDATKRVKVTFKNEVNLKTLVEGYSKAKIEKADDNSYYITVPAASFVIFEF